MTNTDQQHTPYPLPYRRLRTWHRAVYVSQLCKKHPLGESAFRDQANRAIISVITNLCEGSAYDGAMRKKHFRIARASMVEVAGAYESAGLLGERFSVDHIVREASIVVSMLSKLLQNC